MKIIFVLAVYLYLSNYNTASAQDDSPLPDSLQKIFSDDSYYIAYNYIVSDTNSAMYDEIKIPLTLKNKIYNTLQSIYNNIDDRSIDSIYNIYNIFNIKTGELNTIDMYPDTNVAWVKNLINKKEFNGNSVFDNIIKEYSGNIQITGDTYGSGLFLINVNFDVPVNVDAVIKKLKEVEGITHINKMGLIGGLSKQIFYKQLRNGDKKITYFFRWGDCPSGCINYHKWVVTINHFGNLKSIKSSGDEIPDNPYEW